ncbi:hypothetical protein D910_08632 [Dendroctonus ponderosae]
MKWLGNNGGVAEVDGIMKSNMDNASNVIGGPQRTQDDAAVGYVYQRPPDPEFPPFGPKQLRWAHGDDAIIENHDKWKYPSVTQGTTAAGSPSMQGPKIPTPPTGIPTGAHYGAALPSSLYDLNPHSKPHMAQLGGEQLIYMPGGHQLAAHGHGGLSLHHHYLQQQTQLAVQAAQQQSLRQVQQQVRA